MNIAVYCGSDFGNQEAYKEAAVELGKWIGKNNHTLVYGGGESGLMGAVAKEVYEAGSAVIGVIPGNVEFIMARPQPYVTKLITAANMSERKQKMLELADVFLALPGGIGTLDEISEAITLTKIGVFKKPCILFNRNGFYEPLKTMFAQMEQAGFWWKEYMRHVLFSDDLDEIDAFIRTWDDAFYISEIPDEIFAKMQGKSYKADCTVPREDLRYLHVLHMGFDGQTKEGELVVNKAIAEDVLAIFKQLYEAEYPIEKVRLVDEYDADDEASMSDNNSSVFNFRFISHTTTISKHGLGMAVDINTLYNPYVKTVNGKLSIEPANAEAYVDRSGDFPHKIDHEDLCYRLFTKYGFTWGGDWEHSKDYQHFEKD